MDADLENGILWILPKKQSCSVGMRCILNVNSREERKSLLFFSAKAHLELNIFSLTKALSMFPLSTWKSAYKVLYTGY